MNTSGFAGSVKALSDTEVRITLGEVLLSEVFQSIFHGFCRHIVEPGIYIAISLCLISNLLLLSIHILFVTEENDFIVSIGQVGSQQVLGQFRELINLCDMGRTSSQTPYKILVALLPKKVWLRHI